MDVSQTETITETPKELYLLLIFIFAVHLFQVYNGLSLGHAVWAEFNLAQPWYNFREEVQVRACLPAGPRCTPACHASAACAAGGEEPPPC